MKFKQGIMEGPLNCQCPFSEATFPSDMVNFSWNTKSDDNRNGAPTKQNLWWTQAVLEPVFFCHSTEAQLTPDGLKGLSFDVNQE